MLQAAGDMCVSSCKSLGGGWWRVIAGDLEVRKRVVGKAAKAVIFPIAAAAVPGLRTDYSVQVHATVRSSSETQCRWL